MPGQRGRTEEDAESCTQETQQDGDAEEQVQEVVPGSAGRNDPVARFVFICMNKCWVCYKGW